MNTRIEFPVGSKVIVISNEWENLVVGTVTGYVMNNSDIPAVFDNISGKELICCGVMHRFSNEKLKALCKLNPYERWNVVAVQSGMISSEKPKIDTDERILNSYEEYMEKLNGF